VDGHGVVHRISLGFETIREVYPFSVDNLRQRGDGTFILTVPSKFLAAHLRARLKKVHGHRVIIRVAPGGSATAHREVQVTALTVTFSGIGQPQHITAPRHAIQQYGRG
jgi:hypothetical protein